MQFFRARLIGKLNILRHRLGGVSSAELLYQGMFNAASKELHLPPLFPTKAAANYSLLYLILRVCLETPGNRVLEIGAGQSSLLLDALKADAVSLETDAAWAESIGARVGHRVVHAPLVETDGKPEFPDAMVRQLGQFDVVVVDGPLGSPGRRAALSPLKHLAEEFVVIFDDAHRPGTQGTVKAFLAAHPHARISWVHGQKSQCVVFTKARAMVGHF